MSLEPLLFLLFLLVPLVEWLVRQMRKAPEDTAQPAPAEAPVPHGPMQQLPVPPLPTRRELEPDIRRGRRRAAAPALVAVAPVPRLARRDDLRRAVVLMALLGPCRAVDPYDRR